MHREKGFIFPEAYTIYIQGSNTMMTNKMQFVVEIAVLSDRPNPVRWDCRNLESEELAVGQNEIILIVRD